MEYVGDSAMVKHCLTHSIWWGGILCSVHVHTALINNSQVGRELNKQQWRMGKVERKRGGGRKWLGDSITFGHKLKLPSIG